MVAPTVRKYKAGKHLGIKEVNILIGTLATEGYVQHVFAGSQQITNAWAIRHLKNDRFLDWSASEGLRRRMKAIWEAFGVVGGDDNEILEAMADDPFEDEEVFCDEEKRGSESDEEHERDYDYEVLGEYGEKGQAVRGFGDGEDKDL